MHHPETFLRPRYFSFIYRELLWPAWLQLPSLLFGTEDSTSSLFIPLLSLPLLSPPFLSFALFLFLCSSVAFIVFLYPLSTSSPVLSHLFLFPSNRLFSSFHFASFAFSLSLKQPPSVSLVLLDTNGQSKLRHYEVPCTEVTPLRSHHFGSTNTAATLGRSPHLESGMRERGLSSLPPLHPPYQPSANYPALWRLKRGTRTYSAVVLIGTRY